MWGQEPVKLEKNKTLRMREESTVVEWEGAKWANALGGGLGGAVTQCTHPIHAPPPPLQWPDIPLRVGEARRDGGTGEQAEQGSRLGVCCLACPAPGMPLGVRICGLSFEVLSYCSVTDCHTHSTAGKSQGTPQIGELLFTRGKFSQVGRWQ